MPTAAPSFLRTPAGDRALRLRPGLPALPERLLLAHAEGRVLFIAGAGVSMQAPSCLPDFGNLVRNVVGQLDGALAAHFAADRAAPEGTTRRGSLPDLDPEQRALLSRIRECEYDVALGIMERRMDGDQTRESSVRRAVIDALRVSQAHAPIHEALIQLANRGVASTIVTTNFDGLLEAAARALRVPLQRYSLHDIPRPSPRPEFNGVLHIHGALAPDPRRHSELVLTDRDFGEHYLRRRTIPDFIYDAARIFHIVLVGYSLNDPPMRYLLNAVAADGQRFTDLKERFVFVAVDGQPDGPNGAEIEAQMATWRGRGITPIPFDAADGYRALPDVLSAWANLSPHGPREQADRELRAVLRHQVAGTSAESFSLFGHLFRRGTDGDQVRIAVVARESRADPAWLDRMVEIAREDGPRVDREAHVARLCEVSLYRRLNDPAMLKWAAGLTVERQTERRALLEALREWPDCELAAPWCDAWRAVADHFAASEGPSRRHWHYRLGHRLTAGDRSRDLVDELASLVAPRIRVASHDELTQRRRGGARRPRTVDDLLYRSVTSHEVEVGRGLNFSSVTEVPFLVELADELDAQVLRGIHLARRLGWRDDARFFWLGGLDRVRLHWAEGDDDADRYHRGIAPAVRLLMHAVDRLAALDPVQAQRLLQRWLTRSDPVHARMWAAAAVEPKLAADEEVGRFLLSRSPEQTWRGELFPEVAELRAVRFGHLAAADQTAIVDMMLAGPPAHVVARRGTRAERQRVRKGFVVRELTRIEAAGWTVPEKASRWLKARRSGLSEFVATEVDTEFPRGARSFWVSPTPDADLDQLDGDALAQAVDARLRASPDFWSGPGRGARDWLGGSCNPSRLAQALLAARESGGRYGMAWDALGRRHAPNDLNADTAGIPATLLAEARLILRSLPSLQEPAVGEASRGLSDWLGRWARHIRDEPALTAAIIHLWPHAERASQVSTDATTYEEAEGAEGKRISHDALNSPVGHLTIAFLGACPDLTVVPRPFEDGELRAVRDLVTASRGRPGLVARYGCMTRLPYLLRADEAWTEDILLSRLEGGAESDVLWHAVAHTHATKGVMARLGKLMALRVLRGGLDTEVRRSLLQRVCFATLSSLMDGEALGDLIYHVQQMLRSVPEALRGDGATTVQSFIDAVASERRSKAERREEIFDRVVEPFLATVWPRERSSVTPAVAEAFASIPAACGRRFKDAVTLIRRYLVPFDSWSMHDWGLLADNMRTVKADAIVGGEEAAAALEMLDLSISNVPDARTPVGLDAVLDHIAVQNKALGRDPRFVRLATMARR
jgi:hypothetical protein